VDGKICQIDRQTALIVVDVQNDFCPGGALPVREGDQVVPVFNRYLELFEKAKAPVYAARDWHPKNHSSFKEQGGPWPPHCVQDTEGARFHPDLKLPHNTTIISKAWHPQDESYSEFEGTNLELYLKRQGVRRLLIGGLATDYCVRATTLDARRLGFETFLLTDAIRGIDVKGGDSERAIEEMKKAGAVPLTVEDVRA
jgi:nicotinamidase/pyrazinamidase